MYNSKQSWTLITSERRQQSAHPSEQNKKITQLAIRKQYYLIATQKMLGQPDLFLESGLAEMLLENVSLRLAYLDGHYGKAFLKVVLTMECLFVI